VEGRAHEKNEPGLAGTPLTAESSSANESNVIYGQALIVKKGMWRAIVGGTEKDPNRMPGAVVTMNPYVAAAKFVMQKNASEKDVKKTAAEVVDQITNYMGTLGTQDVPAPQPSPR